MLENLSPGDSIWISYQDDSEKTVNAFVVLIHIGEGLITFKTQRNTVTIPVSRLNKIKRKDG